MDNLIEFSKLSGGKYIQTFSKNYKEYTLKRRGTCPQNM